MMAIGIFGIGVTGIIAMQKVTAVSNQHAKNLGIATHIAESWLDMLATDAVIWNHPSAAATPFRTSGRPPGCRSVKANANTANDWVLPHVQQRARVRTRVRRARQSDRPRDRSRRSVAFCSHLRLVLAVPTDGQRQRPDPRRGARVSGCATGKASRKTCAASRKSPMSAAAPQTFHFVQKITAIRENTL